MADYSSLSDHDILAAIASMLESLLPQGRVFAQDLTITSTAFAKVGLGTKAFSVTMYNDGPSDAHARIPSGLAMQNSIIRVGESLTVSTLTARIEYIDVATLGTSSGLRVYAED